MLSFVVVDWSDAHIIIKITRIVIMAHQVVLIVNLTNEIINKIFNKIIDRHNPIILEPPINFLIIFVSFCNHYFGSIHKGLKDNLNVT